MKNRFLGITYLLLIILLIASCLTAWPGKGIKALWEALILAFMYLLPAIFERIFKILIPPIVKYLIFFFLFICGDLGAILSFYAKYDYWDNFAHFVSGILTPTLGLSLVNSLNKNPMTLKNLKPRFVAVFIFIFAMALGLFWEYTEFISDTFFGGNNMNDTRLANGWIDIGLIDTMSDLLTSQASALFMAVYYYHALKKERWLKLSKVLIRDDV